MYKIILPLLLECDDYYDSRNSRYREIVLGISRYSEGGRREGVLEMPGQAWILRMMEASTYPEESPVRWRANCPFALALARRRGATRFRPESSRDNIHAEYWAWCVLYRG